MDSQAANGGKNPEWDATDAESAKAYKWAGAVKSKFLNGYKVNPEYISYLKSVNFSLEPMDLKDPARNQKKKDMNLEKWKNSLKRLESYVSTHHCLPDSKDSEHGHLRHWYFNQKCNLKKGTLTKWREEMMIATFGVKWTWDPSIHDVEIYGVRYYDFIHDDCRKVAERFREKR